LGIYTQPGSLASMAKCSPELSMDLQEITNPFPDADPQDTPIINLW